MKSLETRDHLYNKLQRATKKMDELKAEIDSIIEELREFEREGVEYMSLNQAAKLYNVSYAQLYYKVNEGVLHVKQVNSKMYVTKSDMEAIFKDRHFSGVPAL